MFDFLGGNGNNDSMEFERFVNIVNQSYNFPMIDCGVHNHQDHRKDSSVRRLTSVATGQSAGGCASNPSDANVLMNKQRTQPLVPKESRPEMRSIHWSSEAVLTQTVWLGLFNHNGQLATEERMCDQQYGKETFLDKFHRCVVTL